MPIQKIRQKLLLLCSICEDIPTSKASIYYKNIFSFYNSLRKYALEQESAEWITTATALWEVRVNKLKKLYSI